MGCCPSSSRYQVITEYQIYNSLFQRNWNGSPYCMWCYTNIRDTTLPLLQCTSCSYMIGHEQCKKEGECPKCFQL